MLRFRAEWLFGLLMTVVVATQTLPAAADAPCGPGNRCEVSGGYYLASAPKDWDGVSPLPVIVYFHGWNGSPEGTFRNRAMVNGAHRRGALFVSP